MNTQTLLKLVVTSAVVVVGGLGFLLYSSRADAARYAMVDVVMDGPDQWVGHDMQIHGWVEPGSIREQIEGQTMRRTFVLTKGGKRIAVRHEGPTPDTFKDQSEVVASGRLAKVEGGYEFTATELMAKCPSKYEGAEANRKLDDKPRFH
ncbi:MAG: cytochrome c maturation protein CcmE [Kofleriaceae bacterium]